MGGLPELETLFCGAWWEGRAEWTARWRGGLGQQLGREGCLGRGVGLRGFQGNLDSAQVWGQGGPGAARGGSAQMDSGSVGLGTGCELEVPLGTVS